MPKWLIYGSCILFLSLAAFSKKAEMRKKLAIMGVLIPVGLLLIGASVTLRSVEGPKTPLISGQ